VPLLRHATRAPRYALPQLRAPSQYKIAIMSDTQPRGHAQRHARSTCRSTVEGENAQRRTARYAIRCGARQQQRAIQTAVTATTRCTNHACSYARYARRVVARRMILRVMVARERQRAGRCVANRCHARAFRVTFAGAKAQRKGHAPAKAKTWRGKYAAAVRREMRGYSNSSHCCVAVAMRGLVVSGWVCEYTRERQSKPS